MAALLWLLIPVTAGVFASVWGGWAAKRTTTVPDAAGVAGYERFRAAMERDRREAEDDPGPEETPAPVAAGAVATGAPDGPAREAR